MLIGHYCTHNLLAASANKPIEQTLQHLCVIGSPKKLIAVQEI